MYNKFHPIEQINRKAVAVQYRRIRAILREAKKPLSVPKRKVRTLCETLLFTVGLQ